MRDVVIPRTNSILLPLVVSLAAIASVASAAPLTTTISATGSGTLGVSSFTNASFLITCVGDTTQRATIAPGIFEVPNLTATINISGIGSASFVTSTRIFNNQPAAVAGFSRATSIGGGDILNLSAGPFATWTMLTGVGPAFDASLEPVGQATGLATSAGVLSFSAYSNGTLTAVVPEPATLAAGLAAASTLVVRRRKTVTV